MRIKIELRIGKRERQLRGHKRCPFR